MVLSYEGDHALFPVSIALFTFHRAFADKSVSSIQTLSDCYDLLAIKAITHKAFGATNLPAASLAVTSTLCPRMRLRTSKCPRVAAK